MTAPTTRWRSKAVHLALLGTAGGMMATGLTGCSSSDGGTYHRNVYRSFEDCVADYSTTHCLPGTQAAGGRQLGPVYRMVAGVPNSCTSNDPGGGRSRYGLTKRAVGVEPVVRGGLGACTRRSTSRRYSSGRRWYSGG